MTSMAQTAAHHLETSQVDREMLAAVLERLTAVERAVGICPARSEGSGVPQRILQALPSVEAFAASVFAHSETAVAPVEDEDRTWRIHVTANVPNVERLVELQDQWTRGLVSKFPELMPGDVYLEVGMR